MAKKIYGIERHEFMGFVIEKCDAGAAILGRYLDPKTLNHPLSKENTAERKRCTYWRIRIKGDPSFVPEHTNTLAKAKGRIKQLLERKT